VNDLSEEFVQVGAEFNIPPALLAAIASRESNVGAGLGRDDSDPGFGDHNHAFGVMQIDIQHSGIAIDQGDGPTGISNIRQGAQILQSFIAAVRDAHPDWTDAQVLRGATAAYNFGPDNVQTLGGIDRGTANNNYSADVWARAQFFDQRIFNPTHPE
jgi:hypothetical protein